MVNDFQHAAAREQFVFHQRDIRFDAGRVAIHQETDRAGRRQHSDLRVAITVTLSKLRRAVPDFRSFFFQIREFLRIRDFAHRVPMQFNHFQHRCDVVLGDRFRDTAGACVAVTGKRPDRPRQSGALLVRFTGHDGSNRAAERPAFDTIVAETVTHDERSEVGVAKSERAEDMRVLRDLLDRITGVIDDDLLRGDENADRRFETLDIEVAIRRLEFHQIQRSEIARGVVEEEIFRAWIGGILPARAFAGVPFVDRGVELHSRIAADVGAFGDLAQQRARFFAFAWFAVASRGASTIRGLPAPLP